MNGMNKSPDLEMIVLQEISSAIVNERNGTVLLQHILDILYRRMKMLRGTFTIRHGNDLMIEASHGLDEQEMKRGHYHVGEGITGHVAETGRPHVIEDISRDRRFLNRTRTRKSGEKVAFICVPIIHLQQVIGTLSIDRPVDAETDLERDLKLMQIVGNIAGDALAACLQAHEEREALVAENEKLRELLTSNPGELIGNCRPMLQVYEQIRQVAPSDATVLIRGSSGTGKELVARAVVNLSARKDKPLITMNCAAMPENLLESELFGHEKGSFTGATSRRIGRAEAADGGTLFLDEIGDLSLQMQVKLLRFLQEKTFSRVGSNRELHSDVRFIAATSRNLEELMAEMGRNPLIEGVTLSGGEPFAQAADCAALAQAAHARGLNVWTYSGYLFEHLRDSGNPDWTALLAQTDVLVDGPFLAKEKSYELHFRGSRNQRLIDVPRSLAQGRVVLWQEEDPLAKFTVPES